MAQGGLHYTGPQAVGSLLYDPTCYRKVANWTPNMRNVPDKEPCIHSPVNRK